PVAHVRERLADLCDELVSDLDRLLVVMERRDQVLYARPAILPVDVAQPAYRLHPTHLDAPPLLRDDEFLDVDRIGNLVVPDLDLDAPIARPAFGGVVWRDGSGVAVPLVRHRLRGEIERALQELGRL